MASRLKSYTACNMRKHGCMWRYVVIYDNDMSVIYS